MSVPHPQQLLNDKDHQKEVARQMEAKRENNQTALVISLFIGVVVAGLVTAALVFTWMSKHGGLPI